MNKLKNTNVIDWLKAQKIHIKAHQNDIDTETLKETDFENNPIKEFVKGKIIDKLEDLKGFEEQHYMCDLSYTLFESENVNGAYFCSNYTAKEWVNKNFEYIGEIAEEIKFQFDSDYANKILLDIFDNPDRLIVVIVLEVASYLISRCNTADKYWNDEITLTDEILNNLIEEIEEL